MARMVTDGRIGIDLTQVDLAPTVALGGARFALGETVFADSGRYIYGQCNGAVVVGYLCKYVEGVYDFDTMTTAESGSTETHAGIFVGSRDAADNEFGWFWTGMGSEEVYVTTTISADVQLTTHSTAGQVSTGGDNVFELFTNESSGSGGLTNCRSAEILRTNTTIALT